MYASIDLVPFSVRFQCMPPLIWFPLITPYTYFSRQLLYFSLKCSVQSLCSLYAYNCVF